jgi:hypothetical protein
MRLIGAASIVFALALAVGLKVDVDALPPEIIAALQAGQVDLDRHGEMPYAAAARTGQHPPYFHDGSAPDLLAVVNHYDQLFGLNLTAAQKADLVEFLKSL